MLAGLRGTHSTSTQDANKAAALPATGAPCAGPAPCTASPPPVSSAQVCIKCWRGQYQSVWPCYPTCSLVTACVSTAMACRNHVLPLLPRRPRRCPSTTLTCGRPPSLPAAAAPGQRRMWATWGVGSLEGWTALLPRPGRQRAPLSLPAAQGAAPSATALSSRCPAPAQPQLGRCPRATRQAANRTAPSVATLPGCHILGRPAGPL